MEDIKAPPGLPVYDKPREFKKAEIPESVAKAPKPHTIFNKMMGKMLKMKNRPLRRALSKTKKKKIV